MQKLETALETDTTLPINQISTFTLSYLGDAWYELWCRQMVLSQMQKPEFVHERVTHIVRCQAQAKVVKAIAPLLNHEEQLVFRRGKNRKTLTCPKNASVKDYRAATGFECLVGYWYLTQKTERFAALMQSEKVQTLIKKKLFPETGEK
ncbi:MAG: ribonuclease III [SAR324 cluster bacterium]|nr:ribonuclease III [SAR324 cluster bacterium]